MKTGMGWLGVLAFGIIGHAAVARADLLPKVDCGQYDPDCSKRLLRILSGIHLAPVEVVGGGRFGDDSKGAVIEFSTDGVSVDAQAGNLEVIGFEAVWIPQAGGFRIRFTLAESEVLFFCKDKESGETSPPLVGLFQNCSPDAQWGVGGKVLDWQHDFSTGRDALRWLELNVVYNFLKNGNGMDYLRKRLSAYAGLSFDSVGYGSTPNAPDPRGWDSALRGNFGISGLIRTKDAKWEIRGFAGFRPNVIQWDDYAIESRLQVMYHLLLGDEMEGRVGVDASYSHWSTPSRSFGTFASDRDRDTAFVGLLFGLIW